MSDFDRTGRRASRSLQLAAALGAVLLTLTSGSMAWSSAGPRQAGEAPPPAAKPAPEVPGPGQDTPPVEAPEPAAEPQPVDPAQSEAPAKPEEKPRRPEVDITMPPPGGQAGEDPNAELKQLFVEVEQRLREIDDLLWDASAGENTLGDDLDSGISKLLEQSRDSSQSAVDAIDRILQIASEQNQGQGGRSLSPPPPPKDGQGEPKPEPEPGEQQRKDGEVPEQPESGAEPKDQSQDQPGGEQPQDGQEQPGEDENRPGAEPPGGDAARAGHGDEAERWGELPLRVREVFRAEGGEEMPARYRDWIDTYYRRLGQGR